MDDEAIGRQTEFLNVELEEEIYMEQSEGFEVNNSKVCLLKKSLYGLKQAPRCWNRMFTQFLQHFNFKSTSSQPAAILVSSLDKLMPHLLTLDSTWTTS
jgi:hypothetical protein